MEKRNIIVMGASAGGFDAIKRLVADLPADLNAAIFIVWHMAPDLRGVLPEVLNRLETVPATRSVDQQPIEFNKIYVAPPDRHLIVENGLIRVTRGPKENGFRPAVDPLFRSAALNYGRRVIGIILSGALDDGTAGLWTIKSRGGTAIVQDPADAEVASMPEHALLAVDVDYRVPVAQMAALLVRLTSEDVNVDNQVDMQEQHKTVHEVHIAAQEDTLKVNAMQLGELTAYACPECHGVLSAIRDGDIVRYRCHTGHAFSADSLLSSITGNIEDTLWSAIRGVEESVILLNSLGDHYADRNQPRLASMYFKKANDAADRAKLVRQAVFNHERLTTDSIVEEAKEADRAV